METIKVQSTLWGNLPDIDSVNEFSDLDTDCLRELRDVLKKYNNLDRFGISLLHTHFDIAEDEFLYETTDVHERTQLIRPVKIKDYEGRDDVSMMTTCLKLVEGQAISALRCGCLKDKDGHTGRH